MSIDVQRSAERGSARYDWLYTRHSFSFSSYYNPERMNFGLLRVFNEDIIEAGKGFGTHAHDNMEIVTIVLEGALEHRDSMGNKGVIKAGEVQRMSAGTGVEHSEYNASQKEKGHFLQIWIDTKEPDIQPSYEQKAFQKAKMKNRLLPLVSGKKGKDTKGRQAALYLHQDAAILRGMLEEGHAVACKLANKAHATYVFVISGTVKVADKILESGDAAGITEMPEVKIEALSDADVLVIEVPIK